MGTFRAKANIEQYLHEEKWTKANWSYLAMLELSLFVRQCSGRYSMLPSYFCLTKWQSLLGRLYLVQMV